jgi:pilus assembly protein Flp/PilA
MIRLMRRIFRDRRGATAVEYGLILALIVIAMLLALSSLAQETNDKWNYVSSKVNEASDRPHG